MLFKAICLRPEDVTSVEVWGFDNQSLRITDPTGRIQYFWNDPRFAGVRETVGRRVVRIYGPGRPIPAAGRILTKLKIRLGGACNLSCRYCFEGKKSARACIENELSARPEVADTLVSRLVEAGIQMRQGASIELWGGEPLVYIKLLRRLIPALRKTFGNEVRLVMYTNGTLLTQEISEFLIEHRVFVRISHDGPGQCLRTQSDPIRDPKILAVWRDLLMKSRKAGVPAEVHTVITPLTADLEAVQAWFARELDPDVHVAFEGIVTQCGASQDGCGFDENASRMLAASLFNAVVSRTVPGLFPIIDDSVERMVHRIPASRLGTRCDAANPTVLSVDVAGNVLACPHRDAAQAGIGKIENLPALTNDKLTHWLLRENPKCADCPFVHSCRGSCPLQNDEQTRACCANEKVFHSALFAAVWFLLTERVLTDLIAVENNADKGAVHA